MDGPGCSRSGVGRLRRIRPGDYCDPITHCAERRLRRDRCCDHCGIHTDGYPCSSAGPGNRHNCAHSNRRPHGVYRPHIDVSGAHIHQGNAGHRLGRYSPPSDARHGPNSDHGASNSDHGASNADHGTSNADHGTSNADHGTSNADRPPRHIWRRDAESHSDPGSDHNSNINGDTGGAAFPHADLGARFDIRTSSRSNLYPNSPFRPSLWRDFRRAVDQLSA